VGGGRQPSRRLQHAVLQRRHQARHPLLGSQSSTSTNYYFQFLIDALGSTDFSGLASLRGVSVDGNPRFSDYPGGSFYGEGSRTRSARARLAVMFNTNRHNGNDVIYAGAGGRHGERRRR